MTESPSSEKISGLVVYEQSESMLRTRAAEYTGLTIVDVDDKVGLGRVHDARIELRSYRIDIEKTRKALKADALEFGRRVDAEAKRLTELIEPTELELGREEDRIESEKAKLKQEKLDQRIDAMAQFGARVPPSVVGKMTDAEFEKCLDTARIAYEEAEKKRIETEEKERLEREAAAAERLRMEQEAERLRTQQEADRLERLRTEETERVARVAREEDERASRREAEEERARLERKRLADEKRQLDERTALLRQEEEATRNRLRREEEAAAERRRVEDAERERQQVVKEKWLSDELSRQREAVRTMEEEARRTHKLEEDKLSADRAIVEAERVRVEAERKKFEADMARSVGKAITLPATEPTREMFVHPARPGEQELHTIDVETEIEFPDSLGFPETTELASVQPWMSTMLNPVSEKIGMEIMVERTRQVVRYKDAHEDYKRGELAIAASSLAMHHTLGFVDIENTEPQDKPDYGLGAWGLCTKNACDTRRCLVIAAALLIAEIERLDAQAAITL